MTINTNGGGKPVYYIGELLIDTFGGTRTISLKKGKFHWLAADLGRWRLEDGTLAMTVQLKEGHINNKGHHLTVPRLLIETVHSDLKNEKVFRAITHTAQARALNWPLGKFYLAYLYETKGFFVTDDRVKFRKGEEWSINRNREGQFVQIFYDTLEPFIPEWKQRNE